MTRYYGVECKTCEMTIALGAVSSQDGTVTFYAPPLDAVPCKACGSSYQYGSDDLFQFEGEDHIEVFDPVKKSK